MTALKLGTTPDGKAFALPVELVTQSIAILAKKRVGKSYTAAVMAEELMRAALKAIGAVRATQQPVGQQEKS